MNYITGGFLAFLSIEDMRKKTLPVWVLLIGGIGCLIYGVKNLSVGVVFSGAFPGVLMIVVSRLMPQSIGIGDGVVTVLYGMLYGWEKTCVWLMNSFLLVAVVGIIVNCACRRKKAEIPFVPFLTAVHIGMCL